MTSKSNTAAKQAALMFSMFFRVVGAAAAASFGIVLCAVLFGCSGASFDIAPEGRDFGLAQDGDAGDAGGDNAGDETARDDDAAADSADSADAPLLDGASDMHVDTGIAVDTGAASDTGADTGTAKDSGSVETGCHVDEDGDGYLSMLCPGGLDCDDKDPSAHFGQNGFFSVASKGTGSFDFNCNGTVEKESAAFATCMFDGSKCNTTQGWVNEMPECGKTGTWLLYATHSGAGTDCYFTTETRTMKCR